jgi:hypothetical protein
MKFTSIALFAASASAAAFPLDAATDGKSNFDVSSVLSPLTYE